MLTRYLAIRPPIAVPIALLVAFLVAVPCSGQQGVSGPSFEIGQGPNLPAACSPGASHASSKMFYKTTAPVGYYYCSGTNTWDLMGAAAGAGTVTHSGSLTLHQCVIGNSAADISIDPNCSTDAAGNLTVTSVAGDGANLTNINAARIRGTNVSTTAPAAPSFFSANVSGGVTTAEWLESIGGSLGKIPAIVRTGTVTPPASPLSNAGWSVTCDSVETNTGAPGYFACSHLLDDPSLGHVWGTPWYQCTQDGGPNTCPELPHWVMTDMGASQTIGSFGYYMRTDGYFATGGGNPTAYQLFTSNDAGCGAPGFSGWGTAIATGTWVPSLEWKYIDFAPATIRCAKLLITAVDKAYIAFGSGVAMWASNQITANTPTSVAAMWSLPARYMKKDCLVAGDGVSDDTYALNKCITDLADHQTLLCEPGLNIATTGITVKDKIGIVISAADGAQRPTDYTHAACRITYTGAAHGTVIDANGVRDATLFQGFGINMGVADYGVKEGNVGSVNISTHNKYWNQQIGTASATSATEGYHFGSASGQNDDEHDISFAGCNFAPLITGTCFKAQHSNVLGLKFDNISMFGVAKGWDWGSGGPYTVAKGNGYAIGTLYYGRAPTVIGHDDYEWVQMVADLSSTFGLTGLQHGRYVPCIPAASGLDAGACGGTYLTGTAGHPFFRTAGGSLDLTNLFSYGLVTSGLTMVNCTGSYCTTNNSVFTGGNNSSWYGAASGDPGALTFPIRHLSLNSISRYNDWVGVSDSSVKNNWLGRNFVDYYGQGFYGLGMYGGTIDTVATRLVINMTPCDRDQLCLGNGTLELTGVHPVLNYPSISYTGTAGSTTRTYRIMACDDASCAAGHRSIPSVAIAKGSTQATLDGSNYITLAWTRAWLATSFGILEQNPSNSTQFNLLMTGITPAAACTGSTCTVNVTTDSGSYAYVYPTYDETAGAIWRNPNKFYNGASLTGYSDAGSTATYTIAGTGSTFPVQVSTPKLTGITDTGEVANLRAATSSALAVQYIDWNASSGGASIKNKPALPSTTTCPSTDKLSAYNASTGAFTCSSDQTGAGGAGMPVAEDDKTAQTADLGDTLLYAVPADGAGVYRASCYVVVTTPGTDSSTLPGCNLSYTDQDTSAGEAAAITKTNTANAAGTSSALTAQGTNEGTLVVRAKASTNINYGASGYASSGATAMQYAVHIKLEKLPNPSTTIATLNGSSLPAQTFVNGANISVTTNTGAGTHTIAVTGLAAVATSGAYSDLTGPPTLPANTTSTASQWFSAYNSTTGAFTKSQPSCSDISGAGTGCAGAAMAYPGAGLALSTGAAWDASLTETDGYVVYGTGGTWSKSNAPALDASNMTGNPALSAANMTSFPTLNQSTTGSAASLAAAYIDWSLSSGGASILNKPTLAASATTDTTNAANISSGTLPAARLPAQTLNSGTSRTVANNNEYYVCTSTCTVTPLTPAAGRQLCVRNAPGVSTVITLAAIASSYYEKIDNSGYGTVNSTMTSGGAAGDMVCLVGLDATHYLVMNYYGAWTAN